MKPTLWLGLGALLVLASCTSGTEGLFASIEREQKIVSLGGLNQYATVTSMAETDNQFYAAGGRALFSRDLTGKKWKAHSVKGSSEVMAVGALNNDVFVVAGGKLWVSSDDADTWTNITPASTKAASLVPVIGTDGYTVESYVLVTDDDGDKKTIFHVTDATTPTEEVNLGTSVSMSSLSAEVTAAVNSGTNEYYLVSANYVWLISNAAWSTASQVTSVPSHEFTGLLYEATADNLYLTTRDGNLYRWATPSGTSASFNPLESNVELDNGHQTWLASMLWNTHTNTVWIATGAAESDTGKEGNGYLEWDDDGSQLLSEGDLNTDDNNYTSSALPTSAVGTLFRSSGGDYYLGTVAHGLWKWDSSDKTWSQQ